ncbi:MAG TPA: DUF4142 domain-containing protein [Legionella sp.]|nr:DUF4142 domain-containing protein [Legionella sp.]
MRSNYVFSFIIALFVGYPVISMADATHTSSSVKETQVEGSTLGTLMVLNENEIAAANVALKKSSNENVKNFATFMIKQHQDNLNKTEALAKTLGLKTTDDKEALTLKNKGEEELASLEKLEGSSFDNAYMAGMVKGHEEALTLINNLIAKSSNSSIKKHLEATKMHVEQHLQKAQLVEKSLKN